MTHPTKHTDPLIQDLVRWARCHGAALPGQRVQTLAPGYRGVQSTQPIKSGAALCWVPRKLMMCGDKARASRIGRCIEAANPSLRSEHSLLAAFLLQEAADPDSFWRPYINSLPERFDEVPLFWDEAALQPLQGTFALLWIKARRDRILADYQALAEAVPHFATRFSEQQFLWAMTAVNARCFDVPVVSGTSEPALIPLLDLYNHHQDADGGKCFPGQGAEPGAALYLSRAGLGFTATRALAAGVEVFMSYGAKSRTRFFVNYGFIDGTQKVARLHGLTADKESDNLFIGVLRENDFSSVTACLDLLVPGRKNGSESEPIGRALVAMRRLAFLARQTRRGFAGENTVSGQGRVIAMNPSQAIPNSLRHDEETVLAKVTAFADQAATLLELPKRERGRALKQAAAAEGEGQSVRDWLGRWAKSLQPVRASETHAYHGFVGGEPPPARVQPLKPEDWSWLHQLALKPAQKSFVPRPVELFRNKVFVQEAPVQMVGVWTEARPVGVFCWLHQTNGWVDFFGFQIDHRAQGRGIGGRIMDRFLKGLASMPGIKGVQLNVHPDNHAVAAFYLRRGFEFTADDQPDCWNLSMDRATLAARWGKEEETHPSACAGG
ncbi:GNAT family N-acetyltransferase [Acanthopleuribacter pedis]|uniref:GNAT family N-acetyltransferase n=1 Tax=Acanthopleuribacter pedis TaxID=442870 RepID=A0A8J7QK04_9BACT|nr:GNAT family N-acetyltransferase [Acanthopleuribacter pedis]MBO1322331.1 GNAT family N-acetyltransferase [Acanthopleuribacter pedis]